jgi:hypothetical protein
MALLHIPLDQIDEARLQALIAAGAAESRTIDYKRTIYGAGDSDYSEFLADTSSFANHVGRRPSARHGRGEWHPDSDHAPFRCP